MRSLVITLITVSVLIISWCIFVGYADKSLHDQMNNIEDQIMKNIDSGDWAEAEYNFEKLYKQWHKDKKIYSFFLDARAIMDTDFSLAKAKSYISEKNSALAKGELSYIKEQLAFLHLNELVTADNIF